MPEYVKKYFIKELPEMKVLVQIDPESLRGLELIIHSNGKMEKTKRQFDEDIYKDLEADEFLICSPLAFNLYLKGLAK